jgi:hypothetical protein
MSGEAGRIGPLVERSRIPIGFAASIAVRSKPDEAGFDRSHRPTFASPLPQLPSFDPGLEVAEGITLRLEGPFTKERLHAVTPPKNGSRETPGLRSQGFSRE